MKKFIAATIALIVLATVTAFANASYVGNANSRKFHFYNCSAAQKISTANRVSFNSRNEAIAAGYIPCKRCKP